MTTSLHERALSAFGTALVMGLLGYFLLIGLNVGSPRAVEPPATLIDIQTPPPPPPITPRPPEPRHSKAAKKTTASGPARKSPSAAPGPKIKALTIPALTPVIAPTALALTPLSSGNGGQSGSGQGGGGNGNGAGGTGGDGGGDSPPRQIKGHFDFSDLPQALRAQRVGGVVAVRYQIEVDGRVSGCAVTGSSGNAELDRWTCQLIEQRFRFRPSRDRGGNPVRSTLEEEHSWEVDKAPDPDADR